MARWTPASSRYCRSSPPATDLLELATDAGNSALAYRAAGLNPVEYPAPDPAGSSECVRVLQHEGNPLA